MSDQQPTFDQVRFFEYLAAGFAYPSIQSYFDNTQTRRDYATKTISAVISSMFLSGFTQRLIGLKNGDSKNPENIAANAVNHAITFFILDSVMKNKMSNLFDAFVNGAGIEITYQVVDGVYRTVKQDTNLVTQ